MLDAQGWGVGYGIGISARDALEHDLVWVLPRGKPLNTIVSADLIGVNLKGEIVHPSKDGRESAYSGASVHVAPADAQSIPSGSHFIWQCTMPVKISRA